MTESTIGPFDSIDELYQWMESNNINANDNGGPLGENVVGTTTTHASTKCTCTDCKCKSTTYINIPGPVEGEVISVPSVFEVRDIEVVVKSLTDNPKIKVMPLSESKDDQNIWYVDEFESVEGACSTSKIVYDGNTVLMNVCESNGTSTVNLLLEIEEKLENKSFVLERSCNNTSDHDMILFL